MDREAELAVVRRAYAKQIMVPFDITHPDVAIDPSVPVPDWPLNERGRARMQAVAAWPWASGVRRIFASSEQKARDGAQILADTLGLDGYSVVNDLGENDRSATGYLAKQEFEEAHRGAFAGDGHKHGQNRGRRVDRYQLVHVCSRAAASIERQPSCRSLRLARSKANQFPPFVAGWS